MSSAIGIHVTPEEVRAALVERHGRGARVRDTVRVPLEAERGVEAALAEVGQRLAPGGGLAVGLALGGADVWLKLVDLPPLPPADRARMLEVEAERFFPVRGEPVLVDPGEQGPVAAARAAMVEAWVARVEEAVGPVRAVEPAARGAARAWAALDAGLHRRTFAVVQRQGPWWELLIARGPELLGHARLHSPEPTAVADALASATGARAEPLRVLVSADPDPASEAVRDALGARLPGAEVEFRSTLGNGMEAALAAAVGAALASPGGLLPPPYRARLRRSAQRRTAAWTAAAALAGALLVGVGSWQRAQGGAERDAQAAQLAPRADSAARLLAEVQRAQDLARLTDSLSSARADWVGVLAELAERLPEGAYVTQLSARAESRTLEVRGYAGNASAIVPLLERSPRFAGVETTEAVSRRTVGGVELENFSLRMRVEP